MKRKFFCFAAMCLTAITCLAQSASVLIEHQENTIDFIYPGTPDEIRYDISQYHAMKIDDILNSYYADPAQEENMVFYLEGDKAYYIGDYVRITKGFTLATNPDDIAAGKGKAILYMGGISKDGPTLRTSFFMLGRSLNEGEDPTTVLNIDAVRFMNLDVQVPLAQNYGHMNEGLGNATGNYFMNMYSDHVAIDVKSLEWVNCDFQGLIRGFFRVQGITDINIHELNLKGCTFRNCGFYANGGIGYGYIYADMNSKSGSNILEKVEICENIFYETPNSPLITDANRNNMWGANVRWNLNIHHNTFVNWNTQGTSSQSIVNTRYVPGGSVLGFHDNLIIVTAAEGDGRHLVQGGWDVRNIQGGDGTNACTFDIGNNWTTSDEFSWALPGAFDATSNAPGKKLWADQGCQYPRGKEELAVHVSSLKATDLMVDPNPKYMMDATNAKHTDHYTESIDGLYYQQTVKVINSDIYKNKIGASKLREGRSVNSINELSVNSNDNEVYYSPTGVKTSKPIRGINIIRKANSAPRKVFVTK